MEQEEKYKSEDRRIQFSDKWEMKVSSVLFQMAKDIQNTEDLNLDEKEQMRMIVESMLALCARGFNIIRHRIWREIRYRIWRENRERKSDNQDDKE